MISAIRDARPPKDVSEDVRSFMDLLWIFYEPCSVLGKVFARLSVGGQAKSRPDEKGGPVRLSSRTADSFRGAETSDHESGNSGVLQGRL